MSGRRRTAERGMALIGAVFLVVVLAALAFYMLTLSSTQHYTGLWAVQGARAHYAEIGRAHV